jgi:hypothetical protein
MKTCTKCQQVKLSDAFHKDSNSPDGRQSRCRECANAAVRAYKETVNADPARRAKYLEDKRAYGMAHRSEWKQPTPEQRERYWRSWLAKNREKKRAHRTVKKAMDAGRLIPQPCEKCGATKVEAHHDDYSKRLDVRWLCRKHHREHHRPKPEGALGVAKQEDGKEDFTKNPMPFGNEV